MSELPQNVVAASAKIRPIYDIGAVGTGEGAKRAEA